MPRLRLHYTTCDMCDKVMSFTNKKMYQYKISIHGTSYRYFCSYACWIAAKRAKEKENPWLHNGKKRGDQIETIGV